jgi:hypothetical protein
MTDAEQNLVLAMLGQAVEAVTSNDWPRAEGWLRRVENEQTFHAIGNLAERLGGDRGAMWFGAPAPERLYTGP